MRKQILGTWLTALSLLAAIGLAVAQQPQFSVELVRTFDHPGSESFLDRTGAINSRADIAGTLSQEGGFSGGFILFGDGRFSQPLSYPGAMQTSLIGINDDRETCGFYIGSDGAPHGFLDSHGTLTSYDVVGSISTTVTGVNNSGDFAGNYQSPTGIFLEGYVSLGGNFSSIDIPGEVGTVAGGINNPGQVVGFSLDQNFFTTHGFLRAQNGALTYPIDYPGTDVAGTDPEAINDRGVVVGNWIDNSGIEHGLVVQMSTNTFVTFDISGASSTAFTGINNSGIMVGQYYLNGLYHGFIARLRPQ